MKKKVFPIGIFLMLFAIETVLVFVGTGVYFISSGKKRIAQIEKYTQAYSTTLSEAFAEVTQVSYTNKSYSKLKRFIRKKIDEKLLFTVAPGGYLKCIRDKKQK